jgi:ADP-ribose pyrophosphatase YjhB (NUDIX family)
MSGGAMPRDVPRWLAWARQVQALGQIGLTYAENEYDRERYAQLMALAAEMAAESAGLPEPDLLDDFATQPGYATPKVDVRAAVVRDGRILLIRERADGRWCMPGGWADVGNRPAEAAERETHEESGYRVEACKLVGVFDANRDGTPLSFYHAFKLVFLCELLGGEAATSHETLDVGFFDFDDLPPLSWNRTSERHLAEVQAHLADPGRPTYFD